MENKKAPVAIALEKDYDSEFCGSIPLHLINLIQPHGVLMTLRTSDLQILQVSENVYDYLTIPVEDILDKPLSAFISEEQFLDLQANTANPTSFDKAPFVLSFYSSGQEMELTALVHPQENYLLLELEKNRIGEIGKNSFIKLYEQIKQITSLLKQAATTQEIAQMTVEGMKRLSGYDRVLLYQFDPQWNGIVIGQAKEPGMEDYLGLRFPASDVPRQTRELFLRNAFRLIPVRKYTPVRLLPIINPITHQFTDLSQCNLRSVAAVHLEYMGNMNIEASLTLPLIIDHKLWGLITCHHQTDKNPGYEMRSALELLAGITSGLLASLEKEQASKARGQLKEVYVQLLENLFTSANFSESLDKTAAHIQELLNLTGIAVLFEGSIWTYGKVPSARDIKELVFWLKRNASATFSTASLPKQYTRSREYSDIASGLLVLPLNPEMGEYILGFRSEVLQTIMWGGNPDQAIQMEPDGKSYHPRNSFATYQEVIKNTSLPWSQEELEVADMLRSAMLDKIIRERS